jgi:anaerobic ribonucleoside-triphosphate reductase activating protein
MDTIQIAGYLPNSLVNGECMRVVVFVSGCNHNCLNCHNQAARDYKYGDTIEIKKLYEKIKDDMVLTKGRVTFSGGEPFDKPLELFTLAMMLLKQDVNIWSYTGYTFEEIISDTSKLLLLMTIDILIDGKFIEELKCEDKYIGSSNQRIIDVKKSIERGEVVLWEI